MKIGIKPLNSRVGQHIREVDGVQMSGMPHEAAAKFIAERYAKRDNRSELTMVVTSHRSTAAERRKACMMPQ